MTDFNEMDIEQLQAVILEHRDAVRANPPALVPAFAEAQLALAAKLAESNEFERALIAANTGVDHLRLLNDNDPVAFGVHLASALNNLSNRLSDLERDDEARKVGDEAFGLGQLALPHKPAEARFVLVSTLLNQSGRSWRGGQSLRAIEELGTAVELYREGGDDLVSFLGLMADVLHQNAMALAEGGLWEEAVAVRRMGVALFPEDSAPLPVLHLLALTMQQASMARSREGFFGQSLPLAEEAAAIARDLAETEPGQYNLFLAQSLASLASRQHEAQAHEQALESAVEAVGAFQELAKIDPARALAPLVPTLETFASVLTTLGHAQQAETILGERAKLLAALELAQGQA